MKIEYAVAKSGRVFYRDILAKALTVSPDSLIKLDHIAWQTINLTSLLGKDLTRIKITDTKVHCYFNKNLVSTYTRESLIKAHCRESVGSPPVS